jgi:hypothetical protein
MRHSIELRALEVKNESNQLKFSRMEWVHTDDLGSVPIKKGERPVGVPAARGHGVMEVQTSKGVKPRMHSHCGRKRRRGR